MPRDETMSDPRLVEKRFKPGENGGNHRPKGRHKIKTLVENALDKASAVRPDMTVVESWAVGLSRALDDDPSGSAAKLVMDRLWPSIAKSEISGPDGASLTNPFADLDLSDLSDDELRVLRKVVGKIEARQRQIQDAEDDDG